MGNGKIMEVDDGFCCVMLEYHRIQNNMAGFHGFSVWSSGCGPKVEVGVGPVLIGWPLCSWRLPIGAGDHWFCCVGCGSCWLPQNTKANCAVCPKSLRAYAGCLSYPAHLFLQGYSSPVFGSYLLFTKGLATLPWLFSEKVWHWGKRASCWRVLNGLHVINFRPNATAAVSCHSKQISKGAAPTSLQFLPFFRSIALVSISPWGGVFVNIGLNPVHQLSRASRSNALHHSMILPFLILSPSGLNGDHLQNSP